MSIFLTPQDVQELLQVDRSTVYRMAEDGRLPGIKVGRQWRFNADQLVAQLGLPSAPFATPASLIEPEVCADVAPSPALAEIFPPDVAQSIADLLGELFGVMAVVTDMNGQPLSSVANPCGFYSALADQPGVKDSCLAEWRFYAAQPRITPHFVPSHLGFLCARTFVWVDRRPVGMLLVGGVRPSVWPPDPEETRQVAEALGLPAELLDNAIDDTFDVDVEAQRWILRMLPQLGDLISELAVTRHQALTRLDEIASLAGAHRSDLNNLTRKNAS